MSRPRKPFETCPTCEKQDSIFLMYGPYVKLDGTPGSDRIPAFCNNTHCDQRYWYYPRSTIGAYITRRNTGVTYKDWRAARVSIGAVNSARRAEGMSLLALATIDNDLGCPPVDHDAVPRTLERRSELLPAPVAEVMVYSVGESFGAEQILGERTVYGWWRRLRAVPLSMWWRWCKFVAPAFERGKTND